MELSFAGFKVWVAMGMQTSLVRRHRPLPRKPSILMSQHATDIPAKPNTLRCQHFTLEEDAREGIVNTVKIISEIGKGGPTLSWSSEEYVEKGLASVQQRLCVLVQSPRTPRETFSRGNSHRGIPG